MDAPAEALRERAEELREEAHRSDVRSTRLGFQRVRRGMNVADKECMVPKRCATRERLERGFGAAASDSDGVRRHAVYACDAWP